MTRTSASEETFSVFVSYNHGEDEHKKGLLESLFELLNQQKEERIVVFLIGACSSGKSTQLNSLAKSTKLTELRRFTVVHELGHWRLLDRTDYFWTEYLRLFASLKATDRSVSPSFEEVLASPGATVPSASNLYWERMESLHFAGHGEALSRAPSEKRWSAKANEDKQEAFLWTRASRLGFFVNRCLSYPQNGLLRYGEGLRELGGLAPAFDLAWTVLYETLSQRAKNGTAVPDLSEDREESLFSWATTLARWHGCEVMVDEERELDACLIDTSGRYVIHLSDHLGFAVKTHSILHELAHLVLGHVPNTQYGLDPRLLTPSAVWAFQKQEKIADALASCWFYLIDGLYDIGHSLVRHDSPIHRPSGQAFSPRCKGSAPAEKLALHCASP